KEGERFVMGVGMLFPRKGLLDFIEVAKSFPDVKFIWFGDLKPLFTQLRILRAIKHRPPNVIMAGYCEGDLIKGAYQSASAMFFPSYEENEGIVVLEALASRCPILLRDIEVYRSWLKEGLNCRKANDNEGFIKELKDLLDNGEDPLVLEEGYKVALSKDLSLIGKQLKEAYESLMKK
nr:glycosyltransferase [Bacilli bacterium]